MLHHMSFNVRSPETVARALAEMVGGTTVRAPSPPFPRGAWFVAYGDPNGSLIELLPWGWVLDPQAPGGMADDPEMRPRSGAHVLASTPRATDAVLAVAARHGWAAPPVDAGLFRLIKVWIENAVLFELLPPDRLAAYREVFGAAGLPSLDGKLRALEQKAATVTTRPATEQDQAEITRLVRAERLNPVGLHWRNFMVAADASGLAGAVQMRRHPDGSREMGSLVVRPGVRGRRVASRLIDALLAAEPGPVMTITGQAFASHYEKWGFRPIDPRTAPPPIRRNYWMGRMAAIISFLRLRPIRYLVLLERNAQASPRW